MANIKTGGQPFAEELAQMMGNIGQVMAAPDADMGFLQALQQAIKMRLVQQVPPLGGPDMGGGAPPDQSGGPDQGLPAETAVPGTGSDGVRQPAGAPGPSLSGPTPNGLRREPSIPPGAMQSAMNADEMRRVLALKGKM